MGPYDMILKLRLAARPLMLLFLFMALGIALAACDGDSTPTPTGPTATPVPPTATPSPTPTPRPLSGSVTDAYTGKPLSGVDVIAAGVLTQTATDGMFYYDNLPLNSKLKANAEGYAEYEAETGVVTHLDVKLRPNTISGRVTDKQTGLPLANVLVRLDLPVPVAVTITTSVTPTQALTSTAATPTLSLTSTVPTTNTLNYTSVLGAPLEDSLYQADSPSATVVSTSTVTQGGPTNTPAPTNTHAPTNTPLPPTLTPTPKPVPPKGDGFVAVYTNDDGSYFFKDVPAGATLTFKMPGYKLTKLAGDSPQKDIALDQFKVNAIYMTANWAASSDLLDSTLAWVKNSRINAVVLNVQNDASQWVFDVKNKDAIDAENTDEFLTDMPALVKKLKDQGLYVIARVVTFQQKSMAEARLDWAVKSSTTGKQWKGGYAGQQEWLDPSNPAVQQHMVDMTKEVLTLGFDEVQYDYIRFPSDPAPSETGEMVFAAGAITDTGKVAQLKGFLGKVHSVIEPTDSFMSIDVFGYSLWPDQDGAPLLGVIGQVIPALIDDTDYISPMIYPSHFSAGEQGCAHPSQCAYKLVHKSGEYAAPLFAGKKTKYRPWLEDFDWPDADYTSPGTTKVAEQIQAAEETNSWGWLMWDPFIDFQPRSAFAK